MGLWPKLNHNEILLSDNAKAKGLKVKSQVKAGAGGMGGCEPWECGFNHNETLLSDRAKGLKVKSQVKAGPIVRVRTVGA